MITLQCLHWHMLSNRAAHCACTKHVLLWNHILEIYSTEWVSSSPGMCKGSVNLLRQHGHQSHCCPDICNNWRASKARHSQVCSIKIRDIYIYTIKAFILAGLKFGSLNIELFGRILFKIIQNSNLTMSLQNTVFCTTLWCRKQWAGFTTTGFFKNLNRDCLPAVQSTRLKVNHMATL